ncbi:hypothetical protein DSECCO2_663010 [anaerobic digester metagenome]
MSFSPVEHLARCGKRNHGSVGINVLFYDVVVTCDISGYISVCTVNGIHDESGFGGKNCAVPTIRNRDRIVTGDGIISDVSGKDIGSGNFYIGKIPVSGAESTTNGVSGRGSTGHWGDVLSRIEYRNSGCSCRNNMSPRCEITS